ncbi:E3 ubiquitin-protein ligase Siah1-like [Erinaceus europaeus]|uniref:E3 ubiquitin-protein ligase n=1 Tax=Erinaceus europaeus TaxID=9365 RepID=A0A1S3ACX7_ERIEU|nr:E3 ubiquitin-protein ligase Siah1-like [Erinaceus europaeus]
MGGPEGRSEPADAEVDMPALEEAEPSQSRSTLPTTNLVTLFECPVCFDYVLPPIFQCHSGHLVCGHCRPKLTGCPICRGPLGTIRNLAMEKVASSVLFPCKFTSFGCGLTLSPAEKPEHEELCEFRPYSCPCPGTCCHWQGQLNAVMHHLTSHHRPITTVQGEDVIFLATNIHITGAIDWVMMQACFGHHFLLILQKMDKYEGYRQYFAFVQLIGTRNEADKFNYRMELNSPPRRMAWEARVRSIHEGIAATIRNSDCLVFDTDIIEFFAVSGSLGINVTISRF